MVTDENIGAWMGALASREPVPGGGGAAALAGAMAAALGQMVANLTIGKKKYADVEDDMKDVVAKLKVLQGDMFSLADKDGEVFMELSKAYKLPGESEDEKAEKEKAIGERLLAATQVPLDIMEKTGEIIDLLDRISTSGSRNALSDAGVAAQFARTALLGASLTVTININSMKDTAKADELDGRAKKLCEEYSSQADAVYEHVVRKLSNIRE